MFKINGATNTLRTPLRPEIGNTDSSLILGDVLQLSGYPAVRRKWGDVCLEKKLRPIQNWDFGDFRYDLCLN